MVPKVLRVLAIIVMASALAALLSKGDFAMAVADIATALALLNSARIHELEDKLRQQG